MADIRILSSPDFPEQTAEVVTLLDRVILGIRGRDGTPAERIELENTLESVGVQTETEVRSLLGAAGWGLVGRFVLGLPGLVLGALWGGRAQKEICFEARLKDGRRFLGVADAPTFQKLKAVTLRHP
jgi:hypothetical protein